MTQTTPGASDYSVELELTGGNLSADRQTDVDRLGFTPYVNAVFLFLTDAKTAAPITVSIEGEWGSGKSSFMVQLRRQLETAGNQTVWFSPWRHDTQESLWSALALEFIQQTSKNSNLCKHCRLWWLRFSWTDGIWDLLRAVFSVGILFLFIYGLANLIFYEFNKAALVAWLLASLAAVSSIFREHFKAFFGNPFAIDLNKHLKQPDYEKRISFVERFHKDFKKIIQIYAKKDSKVFVFIDDLDRCAVHTVADMIDSLNLMIEENPNLVFIIGLDRSKIAAAVAAKNKSIIPFLCEPKGDAAGVSDLAALEYGFNYVEKFVQVPINVPKIKSLTPFYRTLVVEDADGTNSQATQQPVKISQEFEEALNPTSERMEVMLEELVGPALDYNPRRIKQFLNLFKLRTFTCLATGLFPVVSLEQLAKFVVVSIRWPALLGQLEIHPRLLDELQHKTVDQKDNDPSSPLVRYWASKPNLLKVFQYRKPASAGNDDNSGNQYELTTEVISLLLQISPRTPFTRIREMRADIHSQSSVKLDMIVTRANSAPEIQSNEPNEQEETDQRQSDLRVSDN